MPINQEQSLTLAIERFSEIMEWLRRGRETRSLVIEFTARNGIITNGAYRDLTEVADPGGCINGRNATDTVRFWLKFMLQPRFFGLRSFRLTAGCGVVNECVRQAAGSITTFHPEHGELQFEPLDVVAS